MPAFHKKPASFSLFLPMKWRIFNGKNSQKFKRFKKFKKFTVPSLKLSEFAVQWIKTWQTLAYLTTKDVFCTISTVIRSFAKPDSSSRFPQRIYMKQAIQHSFFLLQLQSSHFSADTCFRNMNNHLANKQSDKTLLSLFSVLYHAFLNNHAESFSRGDTVNFLNFLNLLNF